MIQSLRRENKYKGINTRKIRRKKIADQQIRKLMSFALTEARANPDLAKRYASIAWNMSTKFNARMSDNRVFFCHSCKKFIVPSLTARIRLSRKRKGLNLTCLLCGNTYRKLF